MWFKPIQNSTILVIWGRQHPTQPSRSVLNEFWLYLFLDPTKKQGEISIFKLLKLNCSLPWYIYIYICCEIYFVDCMKSVLFGWDVMIYFLLWMSVIRNDWITRLLSYENQLKIFMFIERWKLHIFFFVN